MGYIVQFTPEAARQVRALRATERARILGACERILTVHPIRTGRSRIKRLRDDVFPPWRLRIADSRVFYDVDEAAERVTVYGVVGKAEALVWLSEQQKEERDEAGDAE